MKHAFSIIVLLVVSNILEAQTSFIGVTNIGINTTSSKTDFSGLGLVDEHQAERGVNLAGGSGVKNWTDLTGNGYRFDQYTASQQPTFNNAYGSPALPAVFFDGTSQRMQNNTLAPLFSGSNKPITVITLVNSQTNGANNTSYNLGWSQATNNTCSNYKMHPNNAVAANCQTEHSTDTNTLSVAKTITGGCNTNIWAYFAMIYDGSTLRTCYNLTVSPTITDASTKTTTLDQSTIGCTARTNNGVTFFWRGGISGIWVFTNALTTTQYSNTVNYLNLSKTVF